MIKDYIKEKNIYIFNDLIFVIELNNKLIR